MTGAQSYGDSLGDCEGQLRSGLPKGERAPAVPTSCPPPMLDGCSWALCPGSGLPHMCTEHPPVAIGTYDAFSVEGDCQQATPRAAEGSSDSHPTGLFASISLIETKAWRVESGLHNTRHQENLAISPPCESQVGQDTVLSVHFHNHPDGLWSNEMSSFEICSGQTQT